MTTTATQVESSEVPAPEMPASTERLMSLDALRGFDMFWIVGADSLVYALHRMAQNPATNFLAYELDHAEWEGLHFYDLIFPLFVFIMGVSLVFSLGKTVARAGRAEAIKRIVRRTILLFALGIFYSGGLASPWPDVRLMGVLQRIALAYFFGGLLFCFFKPRALATICAGLLLGYWALMALVPVRDIQLSKSNLAKLAQQAGDAGTAALFDQSRHNPMTEKNSPAQAAAEKMFYATTRYTRGKFEPGLNVANHFDFRYLPGRKYDIFWDPEGYVSTIPAVATCLLGIFAGWLLQRQDFTGKRKVILLVSFGVAAVLLGWLWHLEFPVIKKIWTSSFVLVTGGYSALLLAAFYLVVDVWKYQKWCRPFLWLGMNAITVYLVANILGGFDRVARRFVGGDIQAFFNNHVATGSGELMTAAAGLLLALLFVRFLYSRSIFLRL
jgi:predicted acyltransferase